MNTTLVMNTDSNNDRACGALLGLAIGDAVGTTLEFSRRDMFQPITDMVGGGPFHLKPGQWTDDTSMALCLAESLIETRAFDEFDQMRRYVQWWEQGHLSSTGRCFDIGATVAGALRRFKQTHNPMSGSESEQSAGNGSLMRLAPIPIRYSHLPNAAVAFAALSGRTTHGAREAVAATQVYCEFMVRAIRGESKEQILRAPVLGYDLPARIASVVIGNTYRSKPRSAIRGTGYVVESMEAALWAFDSTNTFQDCVLAAANLGDDADTTAAIAGQLAGAHYGSLNIPRDWLARLYDGQMIAMMAMKLIGLQATDTAAE